MSLVELKPWQKLRLKDFPDNKSYMREYHYLRNAEKVLYRRGRYKKDHSTIDKPLPSNPETCPGIE